MIDMRFKTETYECENGELIYVHKNIMDNLRNKTNILYTHGEDGKLILEYEVKRGGGRGSMELYNTGKGRE